VPFLSKIKKTHIYDIVTIMLTISILCVEWKVRKKENTKFHHICYFLHLLIV